MILCLHMLNINVYILSEGFYKSNIKDLLDHVYGLVIYWTMFMGWWFTGPRLRAGDLLDHVYGLVIYWTTFTGWWFTGPCFRAGDLLDHVYGLVIYWTMFTGWWFISVKLLLCDILVDNQMYLYFDLRYCNLCLLFRNVIFIGFCDDLVYDIWPLGQDHIKTFSLDINCF